MQKMKETKKKKKRPVRTSKEKGVYTSDCFDS